MSEHHTEFRCFEVHQGTPTTVYLGVMRFDDLWPLISISPREPRTDDPYFIDTPTEDNPKTKIRSAQRPEDGKRLQKIADFIRQRLGEKENSRKQTIFPNAIILGLLADCSYDEQLPTSPMPTLAHLIEDEECEHLKLILLPRQEATLFVIDGQHRLKGLNYLCEELKESLNKTKASDAQIQEEQYLEKIRDFQIPVSLLIDFDWEEQAMVFADVNFEQKPVSRSFFYDIFGAFESDKVTPISFVHEFVVHLNNGDTSPLKGMIKLLGTGPGFVSQAFMVERLLPLVDPKHSKSVLRTFFILRDQGDKNASRQFAKIIVNFFTAVSNEFDYAWPDKTVEGKYSNRDYQFILTKSMVISGLLAVLRELYKLILLDFAEGKEPQVASDAVYTPEFFAQFLRQIDLAGRENAGDSVFSRNSEWAVGGSTKIERKIFEELRRNLFATYRAIVNSPDSSYLKLCAQYSGACTAANLAKQDDISESHFWIKTENLWKEISEKNEY